MSHLCGLGEEGVGKAHADQGCCHGQKTRVESLQVGVLIKDGSETQTKDRPTDLRVQGEVTLSITLAADNNMNSC